jgi:effector-binding domain-containing protein
MLSRPKIEVRGDQPYAAIRATMTMDALGSTLPLIGPEVFSWLAAKELAPTGPLFWKYEVIDMAGELEVAVGVPIAAGVGGDGRVHTGLLPGGAYATVVHTGHPAELVDATASLLDWAAERELSWDMDFDDRGERWACRLEEYLSDPAEQPDMSTWRTRLAFRLADTREV